MKTEQELSDGLNVLAHAFVDAGVPFQFSAIINDERYVVCWSGRPHEVLGLCEIVKNRHERELTARTTTTTTDY